MSAAFASIIGSSLILLMISKSKKKFADPYRRLIFGISFYDLLGSLTIFLKIFKTTPEQPNSWISLGNQASCNALGWIHFFGLNGALLYNVSLNVYYLCVVRYNMTARHYSKKVEPLLHFVPIVWSIVVPSIILGMKHFNPTFAGECLIAPYPVNCLRVEGVECVRGEQTNILRLLFRVVPTFVAFFLCMITLGWLWWTVESQERKMNRYRMSLVSLKMRASLHQDESEPSPGGLQWRISSLRSSFGRNSSSQRRNSVVAEGNNRVMRQSRRRHHGRVFLTQASWYAVAFVITHVGPMMVITIEWFGNRPHLWVLMIGKIFVPLQGYV